MATIQFQHLTIVRLLTAPVKPPDTADDGAIQKAHLAYLHSLRDQGIILLNGPVRRLDDQRFRGMTIYSVDADQAREYANNDPAVKAGWFEAEVNSWLLPAIPTMLGNRIDSEIEVDL